MHIQMNLSTPLEAALSTKKEYILALKEMGLFTVSDLLLYFPRAHEDHSQFSVLKGARDGDSIVVKGFFHDIRLVPTKNRRLKLLGRSFTPETCHHIVVSREVFPCFY